MNHDELNVDILRNALANEEIGHTVELHGSVPSTMTLAKSLAEAADTRSGALVLAEEQTAGRGRLSRRWETPYGEALLMTVVLKPPALDFPPAYLSMAAGLAIHDAVLDLAPTLDGRVAIKWPNDVLINHGQAVDDHRSEGARADWRKISGILIETAYAGAHLSYALIGMGVNANQAWSSLPMVRTGGVAATSLRHYVAGPVDRSALAIALCARLGYWLALARQREGNVFYERWRGRLLTPGHPATILGHDGVPIVSGLVEDVDRAGRLIVRDETGERHTFLAGDVSLQL